MRQAEWAEGFVGDMLWLPNREMEHAGVQVYATLGGPWAATVAIASETPDVICIDRKAAAVLGEALLRFAETGIFSRPG